MREAGIAEDVVESVVWRNPVAFFGQSGRLEDVDARPRVDQARLHEGSSVLRGQTPVVEPSSS
jgi:hypothetical protein